MSHLMLFRFQIEFVEFLRLHFNRHAFYDFYAEAFEAVDFFRVVRQQAQFFGSQILQNLSADPIFAQVWRKAQLFIGFYGVIALFLEDVGLQLVDEADAPAFLAHVEENAPAFGVDLGHGSGQLFAAVAAARAEYVAGQAFGVDAAEQVFAVADVAFDEGDVVFARQP